MLEFDVAYYLQQNPDVAEAIEAGIFTSALEHFQMFGMGEGRNPNPLFDVAYYLSENPDVAASGVDPLMHFNLFGAAEGRSPSPYFDPQYYFAENPDVAASGMSAIEHYLAFGAAEGRNPGPFFDAGFYLQQNEDVAAANAHPLLHWLMFGAGEERDPNAFFDLSYYLEQNSDVADAGVNGLLHFVQFGAAEGRFPTQGAENALGGSADNFDAEAYLAANPDVAALIAGGAFGSAFEHFMLYGAAQGLPAQTTSGAPIDITGSGEGEGEGGGTGGGGTVTPPPPPGPVAELAGGVLKLGDVGTAATLSGTGAELTLTSSDGRVLTFDRSDVTSIDLGGKTLKVSSGAVNSLFSDESSLSVDGFGAGGKLDITNVDFRDIQDGILVGPNVWNVDASNEAYGFKFAEAGAKSLFPDGVTVNGNVHDAFTAWWIALDNFYTSGAEAATHYYNETVTIPTVHLGNDYVDYLKSGGEAILHVAKTGGNYAARQQTLHDSLLGNLDEATIDDRFPANDPRTADAEAFGGRPYSGGHADTLASFQSAKEWDLDHGTRGFEMNRADADTIIRMGALSDAAIDNGGTPNSMWVGSSIPATNFRIVEHTGEGIELALKATQRIVSLEYENDALIGETFYKNVPPSSSDPEVNTIPTWNTPFNSSGPAEPLSSWNFNFSIATGLNGDGIDLSNYTFKLVLDVDPSKDKTSFVTYKLDRDDATKWLFESAESSGIMFGVDTLMIGGNVGENNMGQGDGRVPAFVSQNSQNYGYANYETSYENLVNLHLGKAKGDSGYWEAERDAGNFVIGLQAWDDSGVELLISNYIVVDSIA